MPTTTVQAVVTAAQQLSPTEQFEVIQTLTYSLQQRYLSLVVPTVADTATIVLPSSIRRTPPVTSLADFAADFWPEDETADDINDYLAKQRAADRERVFPSDAEIL